MFSNVEKGCTWKLCVLRVSVRVVFLFEETNLVHPPLF